MKKALIVLLAIAIAAPAMAVNLTAVKNNAAKTVTFGYANNGTTAATRVRAFALTITADNGAKITGVAVATANQNGNGYGIFPGRIQIATDGTVTSYADPVEADNLHNAGASALNSGQVIIAMGSLYAQGGTAPGATGDLVTVTVDKACTVTATPEVTYRGGVVAEDANAITVAAVSQTITIDECMKSTAPEYAAWVSWGKPACWCYKKQCNGDITGTASLGVPVSSSDLTILKNAFGKNDTALATVTNGICADLNHGASLGIRVSSADLTILKNNFGKPDAQVSLCDTNPPTNKLNFYTN